MKKLENPVIEKDVVLINVENKPAFFARIESFIPDSKPNWWHVKLLILQMPLNVVTWILRHEQINGEEFTMAGTSIRIEKVEVPKELDIEHPEPETDRTNDAPEDEKPAKNSPQEKHARILSFDNKKDKES